VLDDHAGAQLGRWNRHVTYSLLSGLQIDEPAEGEKATHSAAHGNL